MICIANQLTGFYMMATLTFNELMIYENDIAVVIVIIMTIGTYSISFFGYFYCEVFFFVRQNNKSVQWNIPKESKRVD